jgi:hypothetical protein
MAPILHPIMLMFCKTVFKSSVVSEYFGKGNNLFFLCINFSSLRCPSVTFLLLYKFIPTVIAIPAQRLLLIDNQSPSAGIHHGVDLEPPDFGIRDEPTLRIIRTPQVHQYNSRIYFAHIVLLACKYTAKKMLCQASRIPAVLEKVRSRLL